MLVDACSQCIRAHRKCPGYRNFVELLFRDESSKTIEKFRARALSKNTSKSISRSPRNVRVQATPDGPALMTAESSDDTGVLLDEEKHQIQGLMQTSSNPKQDLLEGAFDSTAGFDIPGMHLMPISVGKWAILHYCEPTPVVAPALLKRLISFQWLYSFVAQVVKLQCPD